MVHYDKAIKEQDKLRFVFFKMIRQAIHLCKLPLYLVGMLINFLQE